MELVDRRRGVLSDRGIVSRVPSHRIEHWAPEDWRAYRAVRLRSLAESPDAFASTLEAEGGRSDEEWEARVSAGATSELDLPLSLRHGDDVVGLAWGKVLPNEPDSAHLFQMWVAPECRGQGLGAEMLARVIAWATDLGAARLVLGVTEGDTPARRLYEGAGFRAYGDLEPLRPGSAVRSQKMLLELSAHGPEENRTPPGRREWPRL